MANLEELLAKSEKIANLAVEASTQENIANITDLLVQLASISSTINVELFKAQTYRERAKGDEDDARVSASWADMSTGGSAAHADVVGKVKSIPFKKSFRLADEKYRYIKTFRDNYQTIIDVLRSRVSALKTEQKNI